MKIYADSRYWTTTVGQETTHKAEAIAARIVAEGGTLTSPPLAQPEQIMLAHSPEYVRAVITGTPAAKARDNGIGGWDADFPVSRMASTGGVIAAALHSIRSRENSVSLSSGLHHARRDGGAGFCTFNGLTIAAALARAESKARIVILDLDAHGGGGTAEGIADLDRVEQHDVTVVPFDTYSNTPNAKLVLSNGVTYLNDIARTLQEIQRPHSIDLLIYNAGMDPHEQAGGVDGITADVIASREAMVYEWARAHQVPVAATLAGGYTIGIDMPQLVDLHMLTINAAR